MSPIRQELEFWTSAFIFRGREPNPYHLMATVSSQPAILLFYWEPHQRRLVLVDALAQNQVQPLHGALQSFLHHFLWRKVEKNRWNEEVAAGLEGGEFRWVE
jgi:hypothetical protein